MAIKHIIGSKEISNQETLLLELQQMGYSYTQATLSRDLRFLKISKVAGTAGGYIYRLPESLQKPSGIQDRELPLLGYRSIEFSNHLGVIKTLPGYAGSIASRIDTADMFELLATVAGDDTVLVIPRDGVSRADVVNALTVLMPEIIVKSPLQSN